MTPGRTTPKGGSFVLGQPDAIAGHLIRIIDVRSGSVKHGSGKVESLFPPNTAERFWLKVDKTAGPDGCWPWLGSVRKGYGAFSVRGRCLTASRVAWALEAGTDPTERFVCHRCDNPLCCNPAHLFLGTASDNQIDMLRKGRASRRGRKKEMRDAQRRVQVYRLYKILGSQRAVAEILDLSLPRICQLIKRARSEAAA